MEPWIYNNQILEEIPEGAYGFVYLIENHNTQKSYIGKKFFWSVRRIKQKNKKNRKVVKQESDWKTYYGSNSELKEDLEKYGYDNVTRTILHICESKGECAYLETKEQFDRNVLLDESYYNSWISAKITKNHVKKLKLMG